jgi:hypothetical protein
LRVDSLESVEKVDSMKDTSNNLVKRLREFMEDEARSCSMDFGCVTPLYVYRMWGGTVPMDEITEALNEAKRQLI